MGWCLLHFQFKSFSIVCVIFICSILLDNYKQLFIGVLCQNWIQLTISIRWVQQNLSLPTQCFISDTTYYLHKALCNQSSKFTSTLDPSHIKLTIRTGKYVNVGCKPSFHTFPIYPTLPLISSQNSNIVSHSQNTSMRYSPRLISSLILKTTNLP